MGLDTTHDCWHGAYSSFMEWRRILARAAGLPHLEMMEGFWMGVGPEASGLGLTLRVAADALGRLSEKVEPAAMPALRPGRGLLQEAEHFGPVAWSVLKPDPLHVLLRHSDCDGSIATADCGPLADRLEQLLPMLPGSPAMEGYWRSKTKQFIDGLRAAADAGEDVEFH